MTRSTPPPRSAAERGPGTASGRALLADFAAFDVDEFDLQEYASTILAIEAEAGATAAVPLDVERLTQALHDAEASPLNQQWSRCPDKNWHRAKAEGIATAYARLKPAEPVALEGEGP